ncbi:MAG TPA: hypothetical protein VN926_01985, partial [Bradyrhizobium sp.]|nr:hypothetical protein [Bradyrhizobium sp.]
GPICQTFDNLVLDLIRKNGGLFDKRNQSYENLAFNAAIFFAFSPTFSTGDENREFSWGRAGICESIQGPTI